MIPTPGYAALFCFAFHAAQRAFCAAAIFRRAAADIVRFGFVAWAGAFPARFAHRAFCAMLIALRLAADIVRRGREEVLWIVPEPLPEPSPRSALIAASSRPSSD